MLQLDSRIINWRIVLRFKFTLLTVTSSKSTEKREQIREINLDDVDTEFLLDHLMDNRFDSLTGLLVLFDVVWINILSFDRVLKVLIKCFY